MLPTFFDGWPFWWVFVFLFLGALARGQIIYWAARVVTEQSLRRARPRSGWGARVADWLEGGKVDAGVGTVRKWGLAAIPFCYLTVGFQTLVLAGAGVVRMNGWAFLGAQVPGSLAWAAIYSTIGWAVWEAAVVAAAGSPWGFIALLLIGILGYVLLRRKRHPQSH